MAVHTSTSGSVAPQDTHGWTGKPAELASRAKSWAVYHPWLFATGLACGLFLLLLAAAPARMPDDGGWVVAAYVVFAAVLVGLVGAFGWWRDAGLSWRRPSWRWRFLLPLVLVVTAGGSLAVTTGGSAQRRGAILPALCAGCAVGLAGCGVGQFAVRRFG